MQPKLIGQVRSDASLATTTVTSDTVCGKDRFSISCHFRLKLHATFVYIARRSSKISLTLFLGNDHLMFILLVLVHSDTRHLINK
ncbi:hypothetical protein D3C71_1699160 [compost metagenome]